MIKNVLNQLINENTTSLAGCPGCFCKRGNALNNILAMLGGWDQPLLHPLFLLHFCNVWLGGKWLYWSLRVGTHNPGVELQPKLQFLSKTFTTWILLLCEASPSPWALNLGSVILLDLRWSRHQEIYAKRKIISSTWKQIRLHHSHVSALISLESFTLLPAEICMCARQLDYWNYVQQLDHEPEPRRASLNTQWSSSSSSCSEASSIFLHLKMKKS